MRKIISLILTLVITVSAFCATASAQSVSPTLVETIYNAVCSFETDKIDISHYKATTEELSKAYNEVLHSNPSFFHMSTSYDYGYQTINGVDYARSITLSYLLKPSEYKNKLYYFNAWIDEIASKVDKDAADLEKVLFAHEYFVAHFEYDQTVFTDEENAIYDAYNFLKYKTGVCQAYTLAFTALMQKFGIFCTSAIDEPDNHCWNIVKLGDNYYHIDITHDDPITGESSYGGLQLSDLCGRDHLLISDKAMEALPNHTGGWYEVGGDYKCTDNSFENRIWSSYNHPSVYLNHEWFQADLNHTIEYDEDNNPIKIVQIMTDGTNYYCETYIYKVFSDGTKQKYKTVVLPMGDIYSEWQPRLDVYSLGKFFYGTSGNNFWKYDYEEETLTVLDKSENCIIESAYIGAGRVRMLVKNAKGEYEYQYYNDLPIGDTDNDGKVGINDIVNVKKYLLLRVSDASIDCMDLNGDCFIDILDFIEIQKVLI